MVKEEAKKESNAKGEEPMKIYDKYMYKSQEKLKNTILIIIVFLLGFISGYACQYRTINELSNEVNELKTVSENRNE